MTLTKEQQKAIYEAVEEFINLNNHIVEKKDQTSTRIDYMLGMQHVIENPEKYGLKRIEE